jgi:CheY-like chemotaxis protein
MSKIEANKLELSYEEFNFEKMLQKVVGVVNFRVDEKRQNFTVYIDRRIPAHLIGDDQRLSQVIANLLSNAVKFTPEGGSVRLAAHLFSEEDDACTVQVSVKDTGIGISEEQQARLVNSFQQAESSTARKFGGTGLGLAISKRIVEMMDGKIWITSEPGKGAEFTFTVSMKRGAKARRGGPGLGVTRKDLRVLAVDDVAEIREYFKEIMQRFEISCDTAADGEDAIARIAQNGAYDVYFIDWRMPNMDGIELTRRIQEYGERNSGQNPVVIMISATEWDEIESEAKAAGVERFLQKPLFPSAIADCLNEYIGVGEAEGAEGARPGGTESFAAYRILLAEDVEINREIVLSLLEPTKLGIDCAENGAAALEMFRRRPERYDMIFMDVQMPEMDGYEATSRIRALDVPRAKEIPIVAMTANVFREDIEKWLDMGMNGHVGKPLDIDEVLACLRKHLGV